MLPRLQDEGWDFGTGAGFYVDATEEGWKNNASETVDYLGLLSRRLSLGKSGQAGRWYTLHGRRLRKTHGCSLFLASLMLVVLR